MQAHRTVFITCLFILLTGSAYAQNNKRMGTINFPKDDQRTIECLDELNAGFLRWNVRWEELEKTKGKYDFDSLEIQLAPYLDRDILIMMTTRNPLYCAPFCRGDSRLAQYPFAGGLPNDLAAYENFITAFVNRFGPLISFLEIDNEINKYGIHWQDSIANYVDVLQAAQRGVSRSQFPSLPLVVAGLASSQLEWLIHQESIDFQIPVAAQAKSRALYLDLHLYHSYRNIDAKVAWLKARGYNKLISTECAGPDLIEGPVADFEAEKSAQLVKRFSILLHNGVQRISWFSFVNLENENERFKNLGLVKPDFTRNPAFYTYKLFDRKVGAAASVSKIGEGKYRFVVGGRPVLVLWSETGNAFFNAARHLSTANVLVTHIITAPGQTDADAQTEISPTTMIRVDAVPVFVEEYR